MMPNYQLLAQIIPTYQHTGQKLLEKLISTQFLILLIN